MCPLNHIGIRHPVLCVKKNGLKKIKFEEYPKCLNWQGGEKDCREN